MAPEKSDSSGTAQAPLPVHKQYPIVLNGIQLGLGGLASSMALVSPRKSLNLYDNPAAYLCVSASILFFYYAALVLADMYCYKAPDSGRSARSKPMSARITRTLTALVATLAASLILALVFILFGAPATTHYSETLMAAVNVSLLAVTPAVLTLEPSFSMWRRALLSAEPKSIPEKWAAGFFWCTMVTTWAAAYFIPMDWERPWQRWPIPIVGGAFLGYIISLVYVLVRCFVVPIARADFEETRNLHRQMAREFQGHQGPVTRSMAKKDE
ncbi:Glycosylphosphatidylinositol (GPI) anchor assembly protein [Coemansia erecta]|nr:Glycosylphosphatidylinositol (GPI) anchor assembly protein [Coemansia erecta]